MTSKGSSREGRGESSRTSSHGRNHQATRGALGSSPAEPLFPRVHVSETRNGPKAPPRNKMALYEQLTVPSHHFIQGQASGSVWPPLNPAYASQYVPYITNNCFAPCYVPPAPALHVADTHASGAMVASSQLGSQRSMVVDSDPEKELQRVPRVDPLSASLPVSAAGAPPAGGSRATTSHARVSDPAPLPSIGAGAGAGASSHKRVRNEEDFAVPTYSSPKDGLRNDGRNASGSRVAPAAPPRALELRGKPSVAAPERQNNLQEQICSSNICESAAGSDNNSDEFFHSLHEYEELSGDSNASIVECAGKIAPRDVIGAVGEREFWKTRKNLIRQQRIFATQIFELHRVVKVQHCLADSPKSLLEPASESVQLLEAPQQKPPEEPKKTPAPVSSAHTFKPIAPAPQAPAAGKQKQLVLHQRVDHPAEATAATHTSVVPLTRPPSASPTTAVYQYPGSSSSWGYTPGYPAANATMNQQWSMVPQPYMFPAPAAAAAPGYTPGAYHQTFQPVFGAPGAYQVFSVVPRPGVPQRPLPEMPVYWAPVPPNPVAQSSAWYAYPPPPQYYDSVSNQPHTTMIPKSANSTVLSPVSVSGVEAEAQVKVSSRDKVEIHHHQPSSSGFEAPAAASPQPQQVHQQQHQQYKSTTPTYNIMAFSYMSPSERQQQHHSQAHQQHQQSQQSQQSLKVVPRAVMATPESAAGILKSIQRDSRR